MPKSPIVVISGTPGAAEANRGLLLHHQGRRLDSQLRVYSEITCDQACLNDPRSAPADIARVLRSALTHSQPVYFELPRDMVALPCAQVVAAPASKPDTEALAACAQEILERLRVAASPVIMVGVEVRRFGLEAKVAELATRLGVPVVTSLSGRGLLADVPSPLCGTYLGVAGTPEVTRFVEESDALLLLGVIVSDTNFGVSARHIDLRRTIQALDERVTLGYHVYPGLPLAALIDALLARASAPRRLSLLAPPAYPRGLVADDAPITPTDIAIAVNDLMDSAGRFPIAADMGDCLFTALDIENTALVAPAYYATMGFGVPAGLGLQAATGERPLVLVGDGAFQMTGMELGNCRRYGWDPIVVVFNNSSWETLRAFEPDCAFHDRGDWHFADMAQALGGDGVRVQTRRHLHDALRRAVATRGRFQLIDAVIPRGVISRTLRRFVDRIGQLRP